jgi:hypothetical protein
MRFIGPGRWTTRGAVQIPVHASTSPLSLLVVGSIGPGVATFGMGVEGDGAKDWSGKGGVRIGVGQRRRRR